MLEKPVQPLGKFRQAGEYRTVEHLDRKERNQPDHRAHP